MKQIFKTGIIVILGLFLYALGVAFFIEPSGLITGGATGLALFVHHMWGIKTSYAVFVINTVLFLVGWRVMGRRFAANTLLSTFALPVEIHIAEIIASHYPLTDDIIDFLKNDTINKVFQEKITYPTNKVRNEKYNGEATLTNISIGSIKLIF